jgi:hypothetical protein
VTFRFFRNASKVATAFASAPIVSRIRIVHRQKRTEAIWAHIASDDQQIARRNLWQVPVLIAERDNPHLVILPP